MKFTVDTILIALLAIAFGMFLPWWTIALAGFIVVAFIPLRPLAAFFSGFLAIFIGWGLLAWWRDMANESILSVKMAKILPLGGSAFALILVSALIGAIVGGLGSLTASLANPYFCGSKFCSPGKCP